MDKDKAIGIFTELRRQNPNPKCELDYINPYTLLVAVVLSARSTDKGVNKATEALFKVADNPKSMVELGEEGLKEYISTIGLYKNKAKFIIKLSQDLLDKHNGEVPNDQKALEALAGVGRKTANVVRNEIFEEPLFAVDTHVFRVSNRTGLATGDDVVEVEEKLIKTVPKEFAAKAGHWLILHGRYTCKARKPLCESCPITQFCKYYSEQG